MFRPATRLIARPSVVRAIPRATATAPVRRFLSTAPPSQKSRSWKSLAARIGIAGAVIYYYNTTEVFAEEPRHAVNALPVAEEESESLPTIEALTQQRQQRKAELEAAAAREAASAQQQQDEATAASVGGGDVQGLEDEAGQQGAFNPETGEINWDCPCLGGMADGPCGEEFKAAFSCFVYSTEEPKGMDCIEKFKDMQTCFREYPEVYGAELESDEEDDVTADDIPADAAPLPETVSSTPVPETAATPVTESVETSSPSQAKIEKEHSLTRPSKPGPNGLVPESYRPESKSE